MSISIPEIKKDPEIFINELLEQSTQDLVCLMKYSSFNRQNIIIEHEK
tara:strand:- start:678 stop:821 length:144 start_codon:yes stop_codon:yes gene_type:complete